MSGQKNSIGSFHASFHNVSMYVKKLQKPVMIIYPIYSDLTMDLEMNDKDSLKMKFLMH